MAEDPSCRDDFRTSVQSPLFKVRRLNTDSDSMVHSAKDFEPELPYQVHLTFEDGSQRLRIYNHNNDGAPGFGTPLGKWFSKFHFFRGVKRPGIKGLMVHNSSPPNETEEDEYYDYRVSTNDLRFLITYHLESACPTVQDKLFPELYRENINENVYSPGVQLPKECKMYLLLDFINYARDKDRSALHSVNWLTQLDYEDPLTLLFLPSICFMVDCCNYIERGTSITRTMYSIKWFLLTRDTMSKEVGVLLHTNSPWDLSKLLMRAINLAISQKQQSIIRKELSGLGAKYVPIFDVDTTKWWNLEFTLAECERLLAMFKEKFPDLTDGLAGNSTTSINYRILISTYSNFLLQV